MYVVVTKWWSGGSANDGREEQGVGIRKWWRRERSGGSKNDGEEERSSKSENDGAKYEANEMFEENEEFWRKELTWKRRKNSDYGKS